MKYGRTTARIAGRSSIGIVISGSQLSVEMTETSAPIFVRDTTLFNAMKRLCEKRLPLASDEDACAYALMALWGKASLGAFMGRRDGRIVMAAPACHVSNPDEAFEDLIAKGFIRRVRPEGLSDDTKLFEVLGLYKLEAYIYPASYLLQ